VAGSQRVLLGRFAVIVIVVIMLLTAWGIYRTWATIADLVDHSAPEWAPPLSWLLPLNIGIGLLGIAGLAILLTGRRWGLYGYLAAVVIALGVNLYLGQVLLALVGLIGPAVLLAAIRAADQSPGRA
jgi:hypothetical protein